VEESGQLYDVVENVGTHSIRGWVGPRAVLEVFSGDKICYLCRGFESRTIKPAASLTYRNVTIFPLLKGRCDRYCNWATGRTMGIPVLQCACVVLPPFLSSSGRCTYFFFSGSTAPSWPGSPHFRGFTITSRHTRLGRALDE
jgi:hypothetical protein